MNAKSETLRPYEAELGVDFADAFEANPLDTLQDLRELLRHLGIKSKIKGYPLSRAELNGIRRILLMRELEYYSREVGQNPGLRQLASSANLTKGVVERDVFFLKQCGLVSYRRHGVGKRADVSLTQEGSTKVNIVGQIKHGNRPGFHCCWALFPKEHFDYYEAQPFPLSTMRWSRLHYLANKVRGISSLSES